MFAAIAVWRGSALAADAKARAADGDRVIHQIRKSLTRRSLAYCPGEKLPEIAERLTLNEVQQLFVRGVLNAFGGFDFRIAYVGMRHGPES